MTPVIFELIGKKNNLPTKDIFEDFLEWIAPNAVVKPTEKQETAAVSELEEWVKSVRERVGKEIERQKNTFNKESEPNPYQRWPGDKREPYTIMLSVN